ncbi:hypothetical protein POG22_09055 [Geitlerinema sp. CS-897]|nr:hypothetical protein [Geitlerinema sp. CS-897]
MKQDRFIFSINKTSKILAYLVALVIGLWIYGYIFPSLNNEVEIPPVVARTIPELYSRDYYVLENLQFSPRIYYQFLVVFFWRLGFSLTHSYLLLYCLSFFSFVGGLYAIGKYFFQSRLAQCTLPFLALTVTSGTIGIVDLFRREPIPAIYAMGLAIWGIYFCFKHQWIQGYFFFGLATLIQFLVGFLPGCLFGASLLLNSWKNKNWKSAALSFGVLALFVSLVYIPIQLSPANREFSISNPEFIHIYGYLRHPHHIVPSYWPIADWINLLLFYIAGLLLIIESRNLAFQAKRDLLLVITSMFLALGINYVFVEVFPVAFFAKLQLSRTTPFSQLAVLVGICAILEDCLESRKFALVPVSIVSVLIYDASISGSTLPFLIISTIVVLSLKRDGTREFSSKYLLFLISTVCIIVIYSLTDLELDASWTLFLFIVLTVPAWLDWISLHPKYSSIALLFLFSFQTLFLGLGLTKKLGRYWPWFDSRVQIYYRKSDLQKLAVQFQETSPLDVLVLTPPQAFSFRYYSRRSTVWDIRSFPYTNRGILTWKERTFTILGTRNLKPGILEANDLYRQRSSRDLVDIARKYGATHILTRRDWHSDLPHVSLSQEGDWVVYELPERERS